jgi:hypothetical protein
MIGRVAALGLAALLLILNGEAYSQSVAINEIMYAPVSPEPEWIEIYNPDSTPLDLTGWHLATTSKSTVFPLTSVAPRSFLIVTKDSAALRQQRPGDYSILQLALPALTNTGTIITLHDTNNKIIDSVPYLPVWGGKSGKSLERVDASRSGYDRSNWAECVDTSGSSIGAPNSVRRLDHDIRLGNATANESMLSVIVYNDGRDTIYSVPLTIHFGKLDSSVVANGKLIAPLDSIILSIQIPQSFYGSAYAYAVLTDFADQRHFNDTSYFTLFRSIPRDSLIINEIMFQPAIGSCEWVELRNLTDRNISLSNTALFAGQSAHLTEMPIPDLTVPSNQYALVVANASLYTERPELRMSSAIVLLDRSTLNFSNDSATIVLRNFDGSTVDSVRYLRSWEGDLRPDYTGVSLERKSVNNPANDPLNWHASTDPSGATPLRANTSGDTSSLVTGSAFSVSFDPNPFSPDGDGFEDMSTLTIHAGDNYDYALRVRLYDSRGRLVRTLADGVTLTAGIETAFDGKNDDGQTLSPGLYAALIELTSPNPRRSLSKTIGVAIAGKRK